MEEPNQLCTGDILAAAVMQQSLSFPVYTASDKMCLSPTVSPGTTLTTCVPLLRFALRTYLQLPTRFAISFLKPSAQSPWYQEWPVALPEGTEVGRHFPDRDCLRLEA